MKKHRDVLQMQLNMLVKTKQYCEAHEKNPNTRRATLEEVVNPSTGVKYRVIG